MDTFENNEIENQQPAPQPAPQDEPVPPVEGTYHSAGTGRRESPYANSPYVNQVRQEYEYHPQYEPPHQAPQKPPKKRASGSSIGRRILSAVLVVTLVAAGCGITAAAVSEHWEDQLEDTEEFFSNKIQELQDQLDSTAAASGVSQPLPDGTFLTPGQLYARNVNSVVAISSTIQGNSFYGPTEGSSSGSGFILSADGYVVTNAHVVDGATKIEVTTHNGAAYPAEVIGKDSSNDLAVLKIEAENLPAAVIGSSDDLVIGDMVVAIGNPLGKLSATQTVGYVSGINREVATDSSIINMIQTDAAINPGNSGGPLFNMRGEVIGITTAKYSGTTGSGASIEGIGFAIPIDDVMGMISDLVDYGYVTGAYMDIMVRDMDKDSAAMYGLPTGAYIDSVGKGGAADRAGLQAKDIIIQLGDTKISTVTELTRALRQYKSGDTTTVTVIRSGREMTMDITLDEKPRNTAAPVPDENVPMPSDGDYDEWYDYFRRYFGE